MAGSTYAYVKDFELPDALLPGVYMIVRIDGRSFHRFAEEHAFSKPNDLKALQLMDRAAISVMDEFRDIVLAFGESDEFSFLLRKSTQLYGRRSAKILTTIVSLFTASYVFHWPSFFPSTPLQHPPIFDGRIVLYPTEQHVRDYFAWRQTDTHINNLYNTTFWALVQQGGQRTTEAHAALRGTVSSQKHELLFSKFGITYAHVDERFRKGSVLLREQTLQAPSLDADAAGDNASITEALDLANLRSKGKGRMRIKSELCVVHCDIIKRDFWTAHPEMLS